MRASRMAMTVVLLLPASLGAEEAQFGVRAGTAWSDNVYGVSEDEIVNGQEEEPVSDFSARVSPFAMVSDPLGNLTWGLRYEPTYEGYLEERDLDGFDHDLSGNVTWRFSPRWSLTLREGYAIYQNSIRFNEVVGPGEEVTLGFRNQEIRANRTSILLNHSLTRRDSLTLNLGYNSFEYPDGEGIDRDVPSAAFAYQHVLSERTKLGSRVSWTRQSFDRGSGGEDETNFYNLAGTLEHSFSPTLRLEASAGPTLIDSSPATQFAPNEFAVLERFVGANRISVAIDADQCAFQGVPGRASIFNFLGCSGNLPVLTDAEGDLLRALTAEVPTVDEAGNPIDSGASSGTDFTYFAHLALVKDWESWTGRIAYDRSNSENARFGSSSVADTLSGTVSWRPRRLWTFGLTAAIGLQEQSSDEVVFPIAFDLVNTPPPPGVTSVPELAQVQRVVATTDSDDVAYETQSVSFTATRQITQSSSVFASMYWYRAEQDGSDGAQDERWSHLVLWIGLDWRFDPIRF